MEGDNFAMHDLFVFKQTGVDDQRSGPGLFPHHGHSAPLPGTAGRAGRGLVPRSVRASHSATGPAPVVAGGRHGAVYPDIPGRDPRPVSVHALPGAGPAVEHPPPLPGRVPGPAVRPQRAESAVQGPQRLGPLLGRRIRHAGVGRQSAAADALAASARESGPSTPAGRLVAVRRRIPAAAGGRRGRTGDGRRLARPVARRIDRRRRRAGAAVRIVALAAQGATGTVRPAVAQGIRPHGAGTRAGQSAPQAFQAVGDAFEEPLSGEFARCLQQQNLGLPPELVFQEMARRSDILEIRILSWPC